MTIDTDYLHHCLQCPRCLSEDRKGNVVFLTFCVHDDDPLDSFLALDPLQRLFYFRLRSKTS